MDILVEYSTSILFYDHYTFSIHNSIFVKLNISDPMNKFYTIKVQWSLEKTTTLYKNNILQFILQLQIWSG